MSVIIDQFEVIVDSQQEQEKKAGASQENTVQESSSLKPHNIASVLMQLQHRDDRVKAH